MIAKRFSFLKPIGSRSPLGEELHHVVLRQTCIYPPLVQCIDPPPPFPETPAFRIDSTDSPPSLHEVHVLTDGLAGAERRMLGTVGRHQKSLRERDFPVDLLLRGLRVKIEAPWRLLERRILQFVLVYTCTSSTVFVQTPKRR